MAKILHSQLSRSTTARGSCTGHVTVGLTKVACKYNFEQFISPVPDCRSEKKFDQNSCAVLVLKSAPDKVYCYDITLRGSYNEVVMRL